MDSILMFSLQNANSAILVNTWAQLDTSGKASAALKTLNARPAWAGRTINVAYILYPGSAPVPITYGSMTS
jgi:hypothetical protein